MAEKPKDANPIDVSMRALGESALLLLDKTPFGDLNRDAIAEHAKIENALARRLFPDTQSIIESALADVDAEITLHLAEEFSHDPDATTYEKILEGLIQRFETYTPNKNAIRALNDAAMRNPTLAIMLITRLAKAMTMLLEISDGGSEGFSGMIRAKGLAVVVMACTRDWLNDDSSDLAKTGRMLDTRLKQAESLAITLGLIPREEGQTQ